VRQPREEHDVKLDGAAWERWGTWITKVRDDLQTTVNDRVLFHRFRDVVVENWEWIGDHDGDFFCDFVRRCYVARVALGIRRQVKMDGDSISLLRVLLQVSMCAPQLTFDFYLKQFPVEPDDPWQRPTFAQVSDDGVVASVAIISSDIQELQGLTAQVEALADREIAHLDRRGFAGSVTFGDLDKAIDALDRIACKYICVLTGQNYTSLKAKIVRDWQRIFDVPLRRSGRTAEDAS
jgi:hypothetical protein